VIAFRLLARSDLPTVRRWLNTPHVYEWWGRHAGPGALGGPGEDAATEAEVEEKYGQVMDHDPSTHRFIIELDAAPIGLIQWSHLRDSEECARQIGEDPTTAAEIDLLIGEPGAINRGLGTRAIDAFVTTIVFRQPDVTRVVAGPARNNARSIRAFEKAGFRRVRFAQVEGEPTPEAIMVRDKA
jgi:aminoglycoside 6'-N-acetyltransferase